VRNFLTNRTARYSDIPDNLGTIRCQEKIDAILNDPSGYKVTDEYNHGDVRQALIRHFGIKCIYCETSPIASSTFRIDHFRPKKNIKDNPDHTGYYWLAYEWSNLLQSCQLCNGAKSNYFPLRDESFRVTEITPNALNAEYRKPDIGPLSEEKRLLLNPELDNVENHFSFKPDGTIVSNTDEGKMSIKCYALQRDDLVLWRKTISDNLLRKIKEVLMDFENDVQQDSHLAKAHLFRFLKYEFNNLLLKYHKNYQYSLFCFTVFDRFNEFIIEFITIKEHKELLTEAYTLYKTNLLI
jgi:uncharacterized protein (TIGR02646 family)